MMFDRPLFSVASRTYSWVDAIAAASLRGDWPAVEDEARLGLACAARAESEDDPPDVDVSAAVDAFRYARQLLTAEETEQWLERWGLTLDTWSAHLERAELTGLWRAQAAEILRAHPVSDEELGAEMYPALVCSGALEQFAWRLADRAAACEYAGFDPEAATAGVDEAAVARASRAVNLACGSGDPAEASADSWQRRIAALARIELTFQDLLRAEMTPAAMQSRIDAHRADWIRIACRALVLSSEDAAREAALRVRTDGESPDAVSSDLGLPLQERQLFIEDADAPLRTALFSATTGELIGPVAVGDQFLLVLLDKKIVPTLEDAEVRRRAEADVANAFVARSRTHITWHERL